MADQNGVIYSSVKSLQHVNSCTSITHHGANHYKHGNRYLKFSSKRLWPLGGRMCTVIGSRGSYLVCQSTETPNTGTNEHVRYCGYCSNISSPQSEDEHSMGTARGLMRLDARARKDVAFIGSEFLKLDARAREDAERIDYDVKRRAERLHYVATILRKKAQSKLKSAADKHWSNGALEADLKQADFVSKQRAMEDSLMALEFVKSIHDMMVSAMYRKRDSTNKSEAIGHITLEKNGKTLDFLPGEGPADRTSAIQEAYWSIAAALSEADGIDYTDPEELELLVATLIDLDAMDGKSIVSLLAECSSSPDISTRKALANALSAAPSMWTIGNAGMGALQRLAEDNNPAIAAAASKTIHELKKQWEMEAGDAWSSW